MLFSHHPRPAGPAGPSGRLRQAARLWPGLLAFALAYACFSHPDLWETANHSYLFLQSLFGGRAGDFYAIVAAHETPLYYINGANYNIAVYALFGLWELPVFLFHSLTGTAVSEVFLIYWAKLLSAGLFFGCGVLLYRLCRLLALPDETAGLAALLFWFDPLAFYSPMIMGQYDTLCLFFTLWGLCCYARGQLGRFSLLLGAGMVCKTFPALLLVPLVLLAEKRPLRAAGYGLAALWLYVPTTLLYWGRTGDAVVFTRLMTERLFARTAETGTLPVSLFALGYAAVLFAAFLYTPASPAQQSRLAVWLCLAVYGGLFLCVWWHPQWLILLAPFLIVTTLLQGDPRPWFWLDLTLSAGFFLCCFLLYPNQTGAHLLDGGVLHHLFGLDVAGAPAWRTLDYFLDLLVPYVRVLAPVLLYGSLSLQLLFKLPLPGGSPAQRLCRRARAPEHPPRPAASGASRLREATFSSLFSLRGWCAVRFAVGLGCCWLLPVLLEAANAFGLL